MEGQQITHYDIGEPCTAYETNNPSPLHETLVKTAWNFLYCIPPLLSQTIPQSDKG